jgi:hypothetical protein
MKQAEHWYRVAAEGGDFRGAFNLARLLGEGGKVDEAIGWIAKAGTWGRAEFVTKMRAWLAASPIARFRSEGVAALC